MAKDPMGPYEYKGIIMAEHENGCWTNHHSIINYQGQWYFFYHRNDYSPDFDKSRSARIEKLYFNEDGTIQEIKPTERGVGPVKATQKVHIDRYSTIDGAAIEYINTDNYFEGWKTVFAEAGNNVTFNELNFGKKAPKSVVVRVKAAQAAELALTAGQTVNVQVPACADWTEVEVAMPVKIKGMQNLNVRLVSGADVDVDWVKFN